METKVENTNTNSHAKGSPFSATLLDLGAYEWEEVLKKAERPVCSLYPTALFRKAEQLVQSGDERGGRVFRLLGLIASPSLSLDRTDTPFTGAGLEQLSEIDLDVVAGLLATTQDPAMRARFGDLLWVNRKDHKAGKLAAEAYLEEFKRLKISDWAYDLNSLRRGFGLARIFGKKNEPFSSYVALRLCAFPIIYALSDRSAGSES